MNIPERDLFLDLYNDLWGATFGSSLTPPSSGSASGDKPVPPSSGNTSGDKPAPSTQKTDDKEPPKATATTQPQKAQTEEPAAEPETDPMEDLEALTGLADVKADVKELIAFVKMQKLRSESGLKSVPVSLHLVFSGNPGTGKTTVARILARLYKKIGVLSKGQLVEVDRSALVAGYVGQTALKTQEKITEAMGGVLFIDEAYTLSSGAGNDYGQEAIDTILKAMEDHRDDFVVIVAGYPDLMRQFVNSNPGLKSRFNKYFYFADYTADELISIFDNNCQRYDYKLDEASREALEARIRKMEENKDDNFANAREIRNFFESTITNQSLRISSLENPSKDDLITLTAEDFPEEVISPAITSNEPSPEEAREVLSQMLQSLQASTEEKDDQTENQE